VITLELTDDEFALLSGAALVGMHAAGVTGLRVQMQLHRYFERMRWTLDAGGVRDSLATKMRDAANVVKPEVFTV